MSEEKLKPCPGCGSDDVYICAWTEGMGSLSENVGEIRCDCGFRGPQRFGDNAGEEAIEPWNHRPREQKLEARIEELKKENADLKKQLERSVETSKILGDALEDEEENND